ncbi:MAG: GGDEF domain-containing protein [Planctomycetes bacterium]|nr:GGDEF domain-containing protein [Planctomycetota bacterium]
MAEKPLPDFRSEFLEFGAELCHSVDTVLWREGEPADGVLLLLEGTLEASQKSPQGDVVVLRILTPGAVVGEIAAIDGRPRSATIRARTECRVQRITSQVLREVLARRPEFLEKLILVEVDRVRSLSEKVSQVHQRAITDALTGLYNFGFFSDRLELEVERATQVGDQISLAMFDVDHFKRFNDTYGHQEGNRVLAALAGVLKSSVRRGDIVVRYGGEEFVALLYGVDLTEATAFAERVRQQIESHSITSGGKEPLGPVTVSGGIATFPEDATEAKELIRVADANLYRAKAAGRNRIVAGRPQA